MSKKTLCLEGLRIKDALGNDGGGWSTCLTPLKKDGSCPMADDHHNTYVANLPSTCSPGRHVGSCVCGPGENLAIDPTKAEAYWSAFKAELKNLDSWAFLKSAYGKRWIQDRIRQYDPTLTDPATTAWVIDQIGDK